MSLKFALQTIFFVTLSCILIPAQVYSAQDELEQKSSKLFKAIENNKLQDVKALLAACPQDEIFELLKITNDEGRTPLHEAARWGNGNRERTTYCLSSRSDI